MGYVINRDLSIKSVGDEIFIYNPLTSEVHTLNGSGNFIVKAILNNEPLSKIPDLLSDEYDIDPKTAVQDFNEFYDFLKQNNIIVPSKNE